MKISSLGLILSKLSAAKLARHRLRVNNAIRSSRHRQGTRRQGFEHLEGRSLLAGADNFVNRTNLGSVISVTDTGTNVGFTAESGEPAQSGTINSAWWTWTAPANGTLVVDTIGSSLDTYLTLATGSAVNALSVIAQNDDDGSGGTASKVTAIVTSGTAYQFAIDGFDTDTGTFTLNLAFAATGTEDFGDAPTAAQSGFSLSYPTLLADNGARHTPLVGFSLGSNVDTEGDGKPSAAANLDDATGTPDDEDGVTFNGTLTSGNAGSISVFVTNSAGVVNPYLDAWIDYNRDGDWADSGEQIFSGAVVAGTNTLNIVVPSGAVAGQTYSRFRLHGGATGLAVTGLFANGEVEDYVVSIASPGIWVAQGPGPTINAQVVIPPNNPVNGAIQAIAPHPTNANIVFVGTVNGGVWKTTNATTANTWTPLTDTLRSQSIGAIEFDVTDLTFNTLLAGTGRWSNYASIGDEQGQLYYTTNGGTSWTVFAPAELNNQKISAVAARGNTWLVTSTSGGVYRSTNGGTTFTNINGVNGLGIGGTQDMAADPSNSNRFYVSMQITGGIFRTDDAGATWTDVTGTVTGINGASRVRLAVNASAGVVYAAIGAGGAGGATNVWRSADQGGSWTQLDQVFVHNGGQQNPNTSLAADPANANLVYVGGDRIAASPFTGLSYRGNAAAAPGSQWSILVNAGATNTAPHADTRDMAFRADGTLLESDDGGMYRNTNPSGTGSWVAAAGNIQAVEVHNVAYNSLNNTLAIGTQDNGTHLQPTSANTQWSFVNGGDGGDVAIDSTTLAASNQSIVYMSSQNLGGFRRVVYDSNNNFVSSTNLAAITSPIFTTPIELNTIDPLRLLIGGQIALFESTNQGTTNTNIGGPGQPAFLQNAMVYGGSLGGTPNPDLIYVGANSTVSKRTTAGGAFTATAVLPSGANLINDVAIDPNNYNTVFATDDNQVFMSSNGGTSWSDITGNLGSVSSLKEIRTAVYVPGATPYLAVGTRSGVFASRASTFGTWVKLGSTLPDVTVFDLIYNATDNVVIAGTFGRGVWTMPNADSLFAGITVVQSGGSTSVVENGVAANKTDTFTVVLNTQPTSNVVLSVTSGDLTEATVSPATLTFTSANWNIPQTVTVSGVFDNIADGNQIAPITVSVVDAASDDSYDPVADAIVSVTVMDTPNSPPITSVTNQNTATPTFNFTDVSGETNYSLVIIDITSFPAIEVFRTGAIAANATSYTVPGSANLIANHTYRAFLFATTPTSYSLSSGTTGPQFVFTQFTVGTPPVAPPIKLVANSISGIANQPTISWPAAVNPPADSYSVYLINLSTGLLVQSTSGIATNSFTPTGVLADGRYRILVGAQNSFGSSGFGAPFDFTIGAPIPIPTKTVANSVNNAANPPTISWPASPSAATYSVYLISLETGALIQSKTGIASTSFTPINPLANGRYRIYVNATNVVGSSGFGAPFDFTIGAPIVTPAVPTGLNVAGINTLTPTMSWTAVPGAATYLVWFVDRTTNTLVNSMRVTTNSYTNPIALMNGGKYRLFVLATNSAGSSVFSAPLDFTISV